MEVFLKTFELHCFRFSKMRKREIFLRHLFHSSRNTVKTTKLICNAIVFATYVPRAHYSNTYKSSLDPMHS